MTTSTSAIWPGPTFTIAGREIVLDSLEVMLPSQVKAPETYGTLGSDLLARFDSYTLDLRAMRLALGTPNPE